MDWVTAAGRCVFEGMNRVRCRRQAGWWLTPSLPVDLEARHFLILQVCALILNFLLVCISIDRPLVTGVLGQPEETVLSRLSSKELERAAQEIVSAVKSYGRVGCTAKSQEDCKGKRHSAHWKTSRRICSSLKTRWVFEQRVTMSDHTTNV
ncbi:hypothetical protein RRG08_043271 [Elysia crispata]|uniref:Uncharacterized protein n=1 Tax=Elysia crispata TaxID=231223 RepID=A0AAE0XYZ5_9GAST|nr:hypothetical protein RRG08_043271 [Elysia crispata]